MSSVQSLYWEQSEPGHIHRNGYNCHAATGNINVPENIKDAYGSGATLSKRNLNTNHSPTPVDCLVRDMGQLYQEGPTICVSRAPHNTISALLAGSLVMQNWL